MAGVSGAFYETLNFARIAERCRMSSPGLRAGWARGAVGGLSVKRGELRALARYFRGLRSRGAGVSSWCRHSRKSRRSCRWPRPPDGTARRSQTGFVRELAQRREPNLPRRPVPRERHRSSSRPAECYARPRRRGGGMPARDPCPAEWMKDHPARRANTRRYCPARALARMAGPPLSRVEIAGARARGSSARWPREAAGKRSRVRPTRSRIGQSPYRRA